MGRDWASSSMPVGEYHTEYWRQYFQGFAVKLILRYIELIESKAHLAGSLKRAAERLQIPPCLREALHPAPAACKMQNRRTDAVPKTRVGMLGSSITMDQV